MHLHFKDHVFFRSYDVNLQSSLTRILSSALGYSPFLRVSVYGTGAIYITTKLFLKPGFNHFPFTCDPGRHHALELIHWILPGGSSYAFEPPSIRGLNYPNLSLRCITCKQRFRNINRMSIAYAFQPQLRTRLTLGGLTFPRKP